MLAKAEEEGGWGHGLVALWEAPPQLDRRGNLSRRKGQVGGPSYAAGLPIGNVPQPGVVFHVGDRPRENTRFILGFGLSKRALALHQKYKLPMVF